MDSQSFLLNVDDDDIARYARGHLLRRAGFQVRDAATGRAALALMAERPDLVVLDVGLPDISGFDVCRQIKSDRSLAVTPVLQVSATFVKGTDRVRALDGGADGFLIEPVEPEVLVATVNAMLRARRAELELAAADRYWQAAFDAIDDGIALLDSEGVIVRCNQALPRLLGRAPALAGARWSDVVGLDGGSIGLGAPRFERMVGGRWLEVSSHAVKGDAGRGHWVGVVSDISLRRRADEARQRSVEIQDEARRAAEEANRRRDEFLATLSHELRTPLNAVLGWTRVLRTADAEPATLRRALEAIDRNATLQARLVSDLMDVARMSSGQLHFDMRRVHLPALVEAALEATRGDAAARHLAVEAVLDRDVSAVTGDPERLRQVVESLLANAVKSSAPGGRIRIWLRAEGGQVELGVQDEGIGIDPDLLPHVFEAFRQAPASTPARSCGLGLGLAIARYVIERHEGEIEARSEGPGKGSSFIVRLPAAAVANAPLAGRNRSAEGVLSLDARLLDGVRVLAVDDSEDSRELSQAVLGMHGAQVRTARSSAEAMEILGDWVPHVILADIGMPGEDGYGFIARVRALPPERGGRVPAVAWTGYARDVDRLRTLQAGFQVHVTKPVAPHELVGVVATLAGRA
jgi:signal transduction histidine kinase